MMHTTNFTSWWGRHTVETNRTNYWQVGPLHLWIQHLNYQWKITWTQEGNWLDAATRFIPGARQETPPLSAKQVNCIFGSASREDLIFAPSLPDRPLIARLATPVFVLPGEEVNLYLISPLWLKIEMAQPSKLLYEIPIYQLSDTWFGPMSAMGELCYASSTPAFLDLREVPVRLHCVISAITIRNSGTDSLLIEKVNLPLPRLSLFYSPRTGFWTDRVILERKEDAEMAVLRLDRQPPADASPTQFVAGPRLTSAEPISAIRAFSALFRDRSAT